MLNSAIFNSFHNRVEFGTILEGLQDFGGGLNIPNPPSVCHCSWWWAYVPETCRAKNTLIKSPCCIKLAFQIISWGRRTIKQPSSVYMGYILKFPLLNCPIHFTAMEEKH